MRITYETIEPQCAYFTDRTKAFECHYIEGGTLYRRKPSAPKSIKEWANGELPQSRAEWYELFMIDGRKP